jgi:ribosome-binding protein aMBF1 (putative translation factor)
MSTSSQAKLKVGKGFKKLFVHQTKEDQYRRRSMVIMMEYFNELERITGGMTKKLLAERLGTSASYITQLYNGDKIFNLEMIARIEDAFGISFAVHANKVNNKEKSVRLMSGRKVY